MIRYQPFASTGHAGKMAEILAFWEVLKTGKYNIVISDIVVEEIQRCIESKRTFMADKITEIDMLYVRSNQEQSNWQRNT